MVERKTAEQGSESERTELTPGEIGSDAGQAGDQDDRLLFANESRDYFMFRLTGEPASS
ncbi:hypothetical protein [Gordoniibacillus kamchatkensis]|uniref:hypothetical protein n=1 Tax=Gordoniibacillus kamchatkensis TaxID=1590651 RepID=UPI000A554513|nr:hypothetical protein [Paenibacillus sp. VKM B-2647]